MNYFDPQSDAAKTIGFFPNLEITQRNRRGRLMKRNATNTMLCWNPGGEIALVPWPDKTGASDDYKFSTLACYADIQRATPEQRKKMIFIEAMHLIVRDKCDPMKVHQALLGLEEYRAGCAGDMPGIDEWLHY